MVYFIFCCLFLCGLILLWSAQRLRVERTLDRERLYHTPPKPLIAQIPVIGLEDSGKTVFIANLLHHLIDERPNQKYPQPQTRITVEYLPDALEIGLMPSTVPSSHTPLKDRVQETLSLHARREMSPTQDHQHGFVSALFATSSTQEAPDSTPHNQAICHLIDLPGRFFREDDYSPSNIHPWINQADGLIFVIDGPRALLCCAEMIIDKSPEFWPESLSPLLEKARDILPPSERSGQRSQQLYHDAISSLLTRGDTQGLPVWILITKGDLFKEDDRGQTSSQSNLRGLEDLKNLVKSRFFDGLLLPQSHIKFRVDEVSSSRDHIAFWTQASKGALEFFRVLRGRVQKREAKAHTLHARLKSLRYTTSISKALIVLLSLPTLLSFNVINLSPLNEGVIWDQNSLQQVYRETLNFAQNTPLSPLSRLLFKDLIAHRYTYIFSAGQQVLHDELQRQLETLDSKTSSPLETRPSAALQHRSSLIPSMRSLRAQVNFTQMMVRSTDTPLIAQELKIDLNEAEQLLAGLDRWRVGRTPLAGDFDALMKRALIFNSADVWRRRCVESGHRSNTDRSSTELTPACVFSVYGHRQQERFLRQMKAISTQESHTSSPTDQWVTQRVLKMLQLKLSLKQMLSHPDLEDELHLAVFSAWQESWRGAMSASLKASTLDRKLEVLKSFNDQKLKLARTLNVPLADLLIPVDVKRAWDEALAQLILLAPKSEVSSRAGLLERLSWVKPYLEPKRLLILEFQELESRWIDQLKALLNAPEDRSVELAALSQEIETSLTRFNEIDDRSIEEWRRQVPDLKKALSPQRYLLKITHLRCDRMRARQTGLEWDDHFGIDRFRPALQIKSQGEVTEISERHPFYLMWRVWAPIELYVIDQDTIGGDDVLFVEKVQGSLGLFLQSERSLRGDVCQFGVDLTTRPTWVTWLLELGVINAL